MRKRKNANTIIRQYKYAVSTDLRPMPDQVWDIAKRMQQAWNALIPAYADSNLKQLSEEYDRAIEKLKEQRKAAIQTMTPVEHRRYRLALKLSVTKPIEGQQLLQEILGTPKFGELCSAITTYKELITALNEKKKKIWEEWEATARHIIEPFGLDYSQAPNVLERFNGCIKAGRTWHVESNDPSRPQSIQIPFVFPGSAVIPVASLYNSKRRWRIVIEGYHDRLHDNNSRASRRERRMLYLELGLSREVAIPLRLDLHRPLPSNGLIKRVLLCGKKMPFRGWRWHVLFQVEMPIAQIVPLAEIGVSLRICWTRIDDVIVVAQWKDDAGSSGILTWPIEPTNRDDRNTLRRKPHWYDWVHGYQSMSDFKDLEFSLPKTSEERMKMRERRRRVEERWQARRRWLYRNFAMWLVRQYRLLRLPDLNIKSIAEDDQKSGALAGAGHWRQVAAPGDLLTIVKESAAKCGRSTESFSQTSMNFQSLREDDVSLRSLQEKHGVQLFDVSWNSKPVANEVRAR